MNLEEKGNRNLELARVLDSSEFCKLSKFPKEHLCSIIINRLYYGVYLIGKGKLVNKKVCNEKDNIPHSGRDSIWKKLSNKNNFNEMQQAKQLRNIRNKVDYESDKNIKNEIDIAKKIADEVYRALKELK